MAVTDRSVTGAERAGGRAPSWMVVLVAAAVLVAALAVWRLVQQGPPVVLFGDSITYMTGGTFDRVIGDVYAVTTDGQSGERADERIGEARDAAAGAQPDQVIVNLGTNDVMQGRPVDGTAVAIEQIGDAFGGARCVHLVTVTELLVNLEDPQMGERARQLNERIRAIAARRGWNVVPWAQIVRDYDAAGSPQGPLTTDTVHPTEAVGQVKLAEAYDQALASCPPG